MKLEIFEQDKSVIINYAEHARADFIAPNILNMILNIYGPKRVLDVLLEHDLKSIGIKDELTE